MKISSYLVSGEYNHSSSILPPANDITANNHLPNTFHISINGSILKYLHESI